MARTKPSCEAPKKLALLDKKRTVTGEVIASGSTKKAKVGDDRRGSGSHKRVSVEKNKSCPKDIDCDEPRIAERLLLHMQYECRLKGYIIPWNEIAHRLSPGSEGSAVQTYIWHMQKTVLDEGHLIPPPINVKNSHIRGFIQDLEIGAEKALHAVGWDDKPLEARTLNFPDVVSVNDGGGSVGAFRPYRAGKVCEDIEPRYPATRGIPRQSAEGWDEDDGGNLFAGRYDTAVPQMGNVAAHNTGGRVYVGSQANFPPYGYPIEGGVQPQSALMANSGPASFGGGPFFVSPFPGFGSAYATPHLRAAEPQPALMAKSKPASFGSAYGIPHLPRGQVDEDRVTRSYHDMYSDDAAARHAAGPVHVPPRQPDNHPKFRPSFVAAYKAVVPGSARRNFIAGVEEEIPRPTIENRQLASANESDDIASPYQPAPGTDAPPVRYGLCHPSAWH